MPNERNEQQSNMSNHIVNNTVTNQDVITVAQSFTNDETVEVLNYCLTDYSTDNFGFLGSHNSLTITLQRSNKKESETASFFVKSVPYGNEDQAEFIKKRRIFIKESSFFNVIPELMDDCHIARWYPLCYLAKEDAIILEDLRSQGYKMYENLFDNTLALKSALATLARFHSCSILTEARFNQHSEKWVDLRERFPNVLTGKIFEKTGYGSRWVSAGADLAATIAERLGYDPNKIQNAYKQSFDIVKPSKKYCNVICHGDLWSNNLMFSDSSPMPKCILIDFQMIKYAPLVTDLLEILHLNATRSCRKEHEVDLVKFYHSILEQTVRTNDLANIAKVPTLEEIFEGMNELRVYGLVLATLSFPFVLQDKKQIAECIKDSDSYKRYVFVDRRDVTLSYMKENDVYKNMVEGAVIELAELYDTYNT